MDIRRLIISLPAIMALWGGLASCDKMIYDNYDDCPRGVYVNFYSQTECAENPSYPAEVARLNVYAFDKDGILRSANVFEDVQLSAAKEWLIPLEKDGLYTIFAWGNIDDHYNIGEIKIGETTKQQVLMRLKQDGKWATNIDGTTLWYATSPVVELKNMEDGADQYIHTRANLREYTNRVMVSVDSLPHPENYEIKLASSNGSYRFDGTVAKADSTYYPGETKVVGDSTCRAFFTTLKLESGHENTLSVTHKPTGREIFRTDLVGAILSSQYAQNINLRCINDFDIRLVAHHCNCPDDTYVVVQIWINGWLIHSYEIEL